METTIRIRCADKYEAQKVSSMVLVKKKSPQTYISAILDIIGNEMVVSLQDKSAHSLVLYDEREAEALAGYLQSVLEGAHRITSAEAQGDILRMAKV